MRASTYLYEAEHPVMKGSRGVIFGQDGTDQNSFNKVLRRHQNMKAMAAVLHTGLENLCDSDPVTVCSREKVQISFKLLQKKLFLAQSQYKC